MSIEIINPTDEKHWLEARTQDVTSTEIAALFGFSPYLTHFELWHRKREGTVVKLEENERMKWGMALQDAIAREVGQENGWFIRRMTEYLRNPTLRTGASFDFSIEDGPVIKNEPAPNALGLLEVKNVDGLVFRNDWTEDEEGNIEGPPHIEIQVQQQLMVSGRSYAHLCALVGGNRLVMVKRLPNKKIFAAIEEKVSAFWKSIEENRPPSPNFKEDAEFISKLYGYAEPGKVLDARGNEEVLALATEYKRLGDIKQSAEAERDAIKAKLLTMIGDVEKVTGDGFSISAGIVSGGPVSYVREAYRGFRINWSKKK